VRPRLRYWRLLAQRLHFVARSAVLALNDELVRVRQQTRRGEVAQLELVEQETDARSHLRQGRFEG
jgi:hypothetical protein